MANAGPAVFRGRHEAAWVRFEASSMLRTQPAGVIATCKCYSGRNAAGILEWNGSKIPFVDGFFDFILCSSVLSVSPPRLVQSSLDEIARVCRDGGTMVILDKVFQDRPWTAERYRSVLAASGFLVVTPIRFGLRRPQL